MSKYTTGLSQFGYIDRFAEGSVSHGRRVFSQACRLFVRVIFFARVN